MPSLNIPRKSDPKSPPTKASKKQDRLDYLEEGRKVREKIGNERQKIKDI
jgi:hypothetical protein